ncbi:CRE-FRG-1 protein [Caenorhabditis remanei]|uniref:Protein FRG1 homolog n=2 Tax=Caenorhabditis remanei TaxID=31234 RepID=E3LW78_CAERE|nr:CRE-FRG-1 protein [Caenorhabditis remanei]
MPGADYNAVKGGGLKLKAGKKNLFKVGKDKKKKNKDDGEKIDPDTVENGGWRKVADEFDMKGGINVAIEVASGEKGSTHTYIAAMDNGKFTIGFPHPEGEGPNPEEIFALVKTPDDNKISLKTGFGRYVGVDSEFQLVAFSEAIGVREQFMLVFQDGKTAFQAVASPLFLSTVPSKEGHVHVASRTATENEMVNIRTDAVKEGPVDWRSAEDRKSARDCETAYVKMYQHSKVDLKNRHIAIDVKDKKGVKKAQSEGSAHELLLDRRMKMKSDRYC